MVNDYVQQKDKHNRIFVVHRLDEDTSGVLMVAKNPKIQQALQDNWNEIVTKRGYYAIVEGHLKEKNGTIKSYLKKNSQNMMYSSKKQNWTRRRSNARRSRSIWRNKTPLPRSTRPLKRRSKNRSTPRRTTNPPTRNSTYVTNGEEEQTR